MIINNKQYDHIEVFDVTGGLLAMISDDEDITKDGCTVHLCEGGMMFQGDDRSEEE
jgi:hypothetical protein